MGCIFHLHHGTDELNGLTEIIHAYTVMAYAMVTGLLAVYQQSQAVLDRHSL